MTAIMLAGLAFGTNQQLPEEPTYGGKPLSAWVARLKFCDIVGVRFKPKSDVVQAIQSIGPTAVPYLTKWMVDSPYTFEGSGQHRIVTGLTKAPTHGETAMAFRILGPTGKAAIPELEKIAAGPYRKTAEYDIFVAAIDSLAFMGLDAIPVLLKQATGIPDEDSSKAVVIEHFGWMGTNGEAAIPQLTVWARSTNTSIRSAAVSSLGNICRKPEVVLPVLVASLKDKNDTVRWHATIGLGNFGENAKKAIPYLIRTLNDSDQDVQQMAILSLSKMGEERDVVVPAIIRQLKDKRSFIRWEAVTALAKLGGDPATRALAKAQNDPVPYVRKAVLESLNNLQVAPAVEPGK